MTKARPKSSLKKTQKTAPSRRPQRARAKTPPATTAMLGAEQLALRIWADILLHFGRGYQAASVLAAPPSPNERSATSLANMSLDVNVFKTYDDFLALAEPLLLSIRRAALKGTTSEDQFSDDRPAVLRNAFTYGQFAFESAMAAKREQLIGEDLGDALEKVRANCPDGAGGGPYCTR